MRLTPTFFTALKFRPKCVGKKQVETVNRLHLKLIIQHNQNTSVSICTVHFRESPAMAKGFSYIWNMDNTASDLHAWWKISLLMFVSVTLFLLDHCFLQWTPDHGVLLRNYPHCRLSNSHQIPLISGDAKAFIGLSCDVFLCIEFFRPWNDFVFFFF